MPPAFTVRPIGRVVGGRSETIDDGWDAVTAVIELDADRVDADATAGLDAFSHAEVVFLFDRVEEAEVCRGARRPRGNPDWPRVGILAQRAKDRPNRLGVSVCRILAVGPYRVEVAGLDAIDGTPVLDLKPVLRGFAPRGEVREPRWAGELMAGYWVP